MLTRLAPAFLASAALAAAALPPGRATDPDATPFTAHELAQGFRDHTILARPLPRERATADAAEAREGIRVRAKFPRLGELRVIELDDTDSPARAIARLQATGRYEFVEPDLIRHADATPNDPNFPALWAMNNTGNNPGASGGVPGADIKALAAWDIIHDAPNVVVAVVDTGINLSHQDIKDNLWVNPSPSSRNDLNGANFVGGRGAIVSGNPTDDNGHGTHVAGTIGAVGNNGLNLTGVTWRVKIMALKALGSSGNGSVSDLAAAVNYAVTHGAHIINASYGEGGSTGFSQTEFAAIAAARDAGVIFVAAAGNDNADMDISPHYPASHALDNIVSVGASTRNDFAASFSNYGPAVDLFAPGESIVSLDYATNTGTANKSGTSMAAPHVAGALALLKAQFPADNYRQLINRLLRGVDYSMKFAGRNLPLTGRLNLLNALTTTTNRPFNDDFAARSVVTGYSNLILRTNNAGATTESGEPAIAGANSTGSLWFEWTAPATSAVSLDTSGSAYDTVLAVYTGTALGALTLVAANDDNGAIPQARLTFAAQAGVTYEFAVAGKNGGSGLTLLTLGTTPDNDAFAGAAPLTGRSTHVTASNAHCSLEPGEPRILGYAGGTSLWYRWTAPGSGQFQVAAVSADFDPLLAVYTGSVLNALTLVAASDNTGFSSAQTGSLCTFNATAGTSYVIKVDAKDGATSVGQFTLSLTDSRWQAVTGDAVTGAPAVAPDGTIYVGSTDNSLYALNPDGTLKWSQPTGSIIDTCSPAVAADGSVYIGSFDGLLYAFTPAGVTKWTHDFNTPTVKYSVANSPAVAADGIIYVKPSDGFLYALNPDDGSVKWSFNVGGVSSYASPAIAPDGTVYQGSDNNTFYAFNPDGTLKWSATVDNPIYTVPAIDAAGNVYFGVLNSAKFYSFTAAGTLRWVYTGAATSTSSSPCLSADGATVYFGGYDRKLHAVNTATGAARWTCLLNAFDPAGTEVRASSPAVDASGVIYLGCYDFKLYAVNPDGTIKRTWDTGNWIRSCPALFGTSLYVGSNDGKLYAFDLGASVASGPWSQYRANVRRLGRAVADAFAITTQPRSQTAVLGQPLTLSVSATGAGAVSFQWSKNGAAISGATSSSYDIAAATAATAGTYTVAVSSAQGTLTSVPAVVTVEPASPGRLTNLSVRTAAGTGLQTLTVGFVVGSGGPKQLLVRGIGPSLTQFGVSGALADPKVQLFSSTQQLITENDNWSADPAAAATVAAAAASVGAFPLATGTKDAALTASLPSGPASVQLTGVGGTTGIALAELYDTTPAAAARLINVSARAQVETGGGILIVGFALNGNVPKKILIRGIGPGLTQFNVSGVLADPRLDLYKDTAFVQTNNDWGGDAQLSATFAQVGAFNLPNPASKDAAMLVTLAPGTYTAQVSGVGNTTGVALVEVYEVP